MLICLFVTFLLLGVVYINQKSNRSENVKEYNSWIDV
jgi:hypothetical protein